MYMFFFLRSLELRGSYSIPVKQILVLEETFCCSFISQRDANHQASLDMTHCIRHLHSSPVLPLTRLGLHSSTDLHTTTAWWRSSALFLTMILTLSTSSGQPSHCCKTPCRALTLNTTPLRSVAHPQTKQLHVFMHVHILHT